MPAKFAVGDVLGTSLKLCLRKAPLFLGLTALAYLPMFAWSASLARGQGITNTQLEHFESGGMWMRLALDAFSASAIAFGVRATLAGERAGVLACAGAGLRRCLPALLVVVITTLAVILSGIFLVVPGLMVLCVTFIALPVCVIERPGVFASIDRSRELTRGHRMKIFGMQLLMWAAMFLLLCVVMMIANRDDYWRRTTYIWLFIGLEVVIGTLTAVIYAVTYVRLRGIEDNVGDASLGEVFE